MNKLSILLTLACMISGIAKGNGRMGEAVCDTVAGIKSQVGYYVAGAITGIGTGCALSENYNGVEVSIIKNKLSINKPVFANNLKGSVGRLSMLGGVICTAPIGVAISLVGAFIPAYLWYVGVPTLVNVCTGKSAQKNDSLLSEQA